MPAERRLSPIAGYGLFAFSDHETGGQVMSGDAAEVGQLNHSCDPSLGWAGDGHLVALRDIAIGDELTIDYATGISDPAWTMYCHCETYRCRQLIEGRDWQIPQLQLRYAGHWVPAVQRLIDADPGR